MSTNTTLGVEHGGVEVFRVVIDPANPANDQVRCGRKLFMEAGADVTGAAVLHTTLDVTGQATLRGLTVFPGATTGASTTVQLLGDLRTIAFGTVNQVRLGNLTYTAGLNIGYGASERIGFHGVTPTVQGAAIADATGAGDVVATANAILARMRDKGLIGT